MSRLLDIVNGMMKTHHPPTIQSLLDQISSITTMERGKLTEEYRTRPAHSSAEPTRLGPYFKLQAWENGHNVSRRVPVSDVPTLKEDLANFERFNELTRELVEEIITRTRARRQSAISDEASAISAKKNSTKKRARKDIAKRKRLSQKPKRT
jgi:hypothetical protein